jgi:hypothetical protein
VNDANEFTRGRQKNNPAENIENMKEVEESIRLGGSSRRHIQMEQSKSRWYVRMVRGADVIMEIHL